MNGVTSEILGKTEVVKEDLSNIVDVGVELFDATSVDNYVKSLVNHIGKVIFVNRPYSGNVPSMLMDSWEFGSVLEKISADIPEATENESWELENGREYKQDIFYKPSVSAKWLLLKFLCPLQKCRLRKVFPVLHSLTVSCPCFTMLLISLWLLRLTVLL